MKSRRAARPGAHFAAAVLVCTVAAGGCATYTDRLAAATQAAAVGDYEAAINALDRVIGVSSAAELPDTWGADRALATLERGVLQQSLERYADAARDLSAAEAELELIDLSTDPIGTLAGYLYSDSAVPYAALPAERLALNPINSLNYLARGDLSGAAVEARRFQSMREYLESERIDDHGVAALGAYLAGFVFERLGESDRALRYYEEAMARAALSTLTPAVFELAARAAYRGPHIDALLSAFTPPPAAPDDGEVLVVVAVGRVPYKVPERIPVGAAIGIAGALATDDFRWLSRSAGKVVVYPQLVDAPDRLGVPRVMVGAGPVEADMLVDLGAAVWREYDTMKPMIMAAALTRMAARAGVAEGVRAGVQGENRTLADVLALLVEGLLVAADRPDTRSWTMAPRRVYVARTRVAPGRHEVAIEFGSGGARRTEVEVAKRGFAVVVVTEPR